MGKREKMSPVDFAWLRMERPQNLMMIVGVLAFEGPADVDAIEAQLAERLSAFRRFRQRPVVGTSSAFWEDDDNFDLSHHLRRIRLPGHGGKVELQRFVGELAGTPLDPARPLWQIHMVEDYEGGAAAILRIHHAIADGIALIRVSLSLADGGEPYEEDDDDGHGGFGWLTPLVSAIDVGLKASGFTLKHAMELARNPTQALEYLKVGGAVAGELIYLLVMASDTQTRFKGVPRGTKRVAWSEPLSLADVKAVAHATGCSINDVLLSCVAGALRGYLVDKGDPTEDVELRALVPINLRPPGEKLELGNRFGLLALELPVGIEDPMRRLATVRARMEALKTSVEPPVTFGLLEAAGYTPKYAQDQLLDLLANKATAVMTNVPGPTQPLYIAGAKIKQNMFWVPQSGNIGLGVSILSYAGHVQFGLVADAALTPDPEAVIARFQPEFEGYLYDCLMAMEG